MYKTFFDKAEQERRWNPFRDVPYDKINRDAPESLVVVAETFCCVESYLPDYVAKGINIVRPYFGQAWFSANWGYEESKHSVALLEYMLQSGRRTPEHMWDLQTRLMKLDWSLPFSTARQMTIYGCFQEMATFVIYLRQEQNAKTCGDECLATIFRLNAHFQMPGVGIVPDYEDRIKVMREEGKVDRAVFLQKVFFPVLKYLEVTRQELQAVVWSDREERRTSAAE
jgi:acyl-[acyl-carrier-protein] desaturase